MMFHETMSALRAQATHGARVRNREVAAEAVALIERLTAALDRAAARFREYEASHAAKGSVDGDAKARRNAEMAEMCEGAKHG